jgi:lambda family phage portal protein
MRKPQLPPANLLDRLVSWIDPVAGARRASARAVMAAYGGPGGFVGARRDRRQSLTMGGASASADADLLPGLPALRERSRDLYMNAPLARGAVNTVVTNVVGAGLTVRPQIDRTALGLTDDEAEAWEANADRLWRAWSGSKNADLARTHSFLAQQDICFRGSLLNGDAFVLIRFVERPGWPFGTCLQLIEGDRVMNPGALVDGSSTADGITLLGGVEVDRDGAPRAYQVADSHPVDLTLRAPSCTRVEAFFPSGRRRVLHLLAPDRAGATRGVPYLATVIESLNLLDKYRDAEQMAAAVSALFTVFVKSSADSAATPLTAQIAGSAPAPAGKDSDFRLGGGAILDLEDGEDVTFANPSRPNAAFDPFVLAILRQIGVALELPYEILIKHFTASYSAARAAILEAWKFFRKRRAWLAADLVEPVYVEVIAECVARGWLAAPGFFDDPLVRAAWCGCEIFGPSQGQIDPGKEADANATMVDRGWKTNAEVTAEMTGGDWEKKLRQRAKELRLAQAAGVPFAEPAVKAPTPPPPVDQESQP